MKLRSIVVSVFLPAIIPLAATAQSPPKVRTKTKLEPPPLESALAIPPGAPRALFRAYLPSIPRFHSGQAMCSKGMKPE